MNFNSIWFFIPRRYFIYGRPTTREFLLILKKIQNYCTS